MVDLALNQKAEMDYSSCDWDLFKTFTVKNNLASMVNAGAQRSMPAEFRNHPRIIELRLQSKMQRLHSRSQLQALAQIAAAFKRANIPMLSFKGPTLSMELYSDPCMRNSCDLDILVEEAKMADACACLRSLGFQRQNSIWDQSPRRQKLHSRHNPQMHHVFQANGVMVELHWRICYRFEVAFETLWQSRRAYTLLAQPVCTLSQPENLCYLITHAAGHGFRQLRWLLEVYTLMQKEFFQISDLYALMHERGVAMLLLETLLLFYRLPVFSMPERLCIKAEGETVIEFMRKGEKTHVRWQQKAKQEMSGAQKLVKAVYPLLRRNNPEEGLDGRIYKRLLPTLERRTSLILTLLEPRSDDLEWINLPDKFFFLYYCLRPIRFLMRIGKKKRKPASAS